MSLEQENKALKRANAALRAALERASNGLAWYRAEFPDADSPADDEMQAEIDAALATDAGKDFVPRDEYEQMRANRDALFELAETAGKERDAARAGVREKLMRVAKEAYDAGVTDGFSGCPSPTAQSDLDAIVDAEMQR